MRFFADGVDFPDDLLWARDEGRVVFICGAGVSRAYANLPDFKTLTKVVLDRLGTQPDNSARRLFEASNAIEKEHGISDLAASDRIFTELLKHFESDTINREVAAALEPSENISLRAHRIMIDLATSPDGATNLITTNFDRLFELSKPKLKCVTRSNLPNIEFLKQDWGVVHLHGALQPDYRAPTEDGLILSSADFGEAYLTSGWARTFIQSLLNNYTAVFVGYSANDPPIRYLLEGMKIAGLSNHKAYAFQADSDETAISQWDDKGVEAITFDDHDGNGYDRLWGSLEAWAKRCRDYVKWRDAVIKMARRGPGSLRPYERGMVAHLVSSESGALAIARAPKAIPAEWLCVFDRNIRYGETGSLGSSFEDGPIIDPFEEYKIDSDSAPQSDEKKRNLYARFDKDAWDGLMPSLADLRELPANAVAHIGGMHAQNPPRLPQRLQFLAHWITRVSHEPAAVWWASKKGCLHPEILDFVSTSSTRQGQKTPEMIRNAWRRIKLVNQQNPFTRREAYDLKLSLKRGEHDELLAREYARYFEPYLKFEQLWRRPLPPTTLAECKTRGLAAIEVVYDEHIKSIEIPDAYIASLLPKLRNALLNAVEYERSFSRWEPKLSSIEERKKKPDEGDSSFQRNYKFSGHVLLFVALIRRFERLDPSATRGEITAWPRSNRPFERLRIWAFGNLNLFSAAEYYEELTALSRKNFWPSDGRRDLVLGLRHHWDAFSVKERKKIEQRIRLGPPNYKHLSDAQNAAMRAYSILNRVHWLKQQGCSFSLDIDQLTKKLSNDAPDWTPGAAEQAVRTFDGGGGSVRTDKDTAILNGLPPEQIIPKILEMDTHPVGLLVQYEPFSGLAEEDPQRALEALSFAQIGDTFYGGFWNSFLYSDARKSDDQSFADQIALRLSELPNESVADIRHGASRWFEKTGPALSSSAFNTLWKKFICVLKSVQAAGDSGLVRQENPPRWLDEAINSPSGHLTELLMALLPKKKFEAGEKFPNHWTERANGLLDLRDDTRRFVLAVLGLRLDFLNHVDPVWTQKQLLPILLKDNGDEADRNALWSGVLSSGRIPGNALLRALIEKLVLLPGQISGIKRYHSEMLAATLLASWAFRTGANGDPLLSAESLRAIILRGDHEFRSQILWLLEKWSKDDDVKKEIALPFVRDVWPKQKSVRTAQMSARLCELALSREDDFPEFVDAVLPLISRVEDDRIFIPELRNDNKNLADLYPEAMVKLLHGVLGENTMRWPYGADAMIRRIGDHNPHMKRNALFQALSRRLS